MMHRWTSTAIVDSGEPLTVWGGRCIPFDKIDFERRDYVPYSGWPITLKDLEPYYPRAQRYCDCGDYAYEVHKAVPGAPPHMIPGFGDGDVDTSVLERFSLPTDFGKRISAGSSGLPISKFCSTPIASPFTSPTMASGRPAWKSRRYARTAFT